MAKYLFSACLVVCIASCGSDPEDRQVTGVEQAAIESILAQADTLKGLASDQTTSDLLEVVDVDAFIQLIDPTGSSSNSLTQAVRNEAFPDCVATEGTSATFTECEVEGHLVNGSVALTDSTVTADLTDVFTLPSGTSGTATLSANITVSATSIAGSLTASATITDGGTSTTLAASVVFGDIELNENFCPVGGSLDITGSVERGLKVDVERTITFGPNCGDARIF